MKRAVLASGRDFTPDETAAIADMEAELQTFGDRPRSHVPPTYLGDGSTVAGGTTLDNFGFSGIGEQLQCIYQSFKTGRIDERLERSRLAARQFSTINEGIGSEGGFAVPQMFANMALTAGLEDTVLLQGCTKVPMSTNKAMVVGFGDDSHATGPYGITWSQIAEGASFGTPQNLPMKALNVQATKSGAYFSVTSEWLADASPAIRSQLDTVFTSSLQWYCEKLLWSGTGAGQPLGALNSPAAISIAKETGQAAATITTENVVKMWARLLSGSHSRAIWAANAGTLPQLMTLSISRGTGGTPVGLIQPSGISGGPPMSILGRPLYLTEHLPALGSAGDLVLCVPDLYILGDRRQVTVDISPHILFAEDKMAFRVSARFDGQPAMSVARTPQNGDSQSWLLKIAVRS